MRKNCDLGQKPWEPTPRPEQDWMDRHNGFVRNSQENAANITAVFIGSSSIERWASTGLQIWNRKFAPLGAVNYGIGGDRTEHVLWRITNGELDGLNPKIAVVYIGSNNVPMFNNTEVIMGCTAVVETMRQKLPNTPILFLSIF